MSKRRDGGLELLRAIEEQVASRCNSTMNKTPADEVGFYLGQDSVGHIQQPVKLRLF